jgi:hypothetical protein
MNPKLCFAGSLVFGTALAMLTAVLVILYGYNYNNNECMHSSVLGVTLYPLSLTFACYDVLGLLVGSFFFMCTKAGDNYVYIQGIGWLGQIIFVTLILISLFSSDSSDCRPNALWTIASLQAFSAPVVMAVQIYNRFWPFAPWCFKHGFVEKDWIGLDQIQMSGK